VTVSQFKTTPEQALKLVGTEKTNNLQKSAVDDTAELAGWVAISRVLLNLDETITRE